MTQSPYFLRIYLKNILPTELTNIILSYSYVNIDKIELEYLVKTYKYIQELYFNNTYWFFEILSKNKKYDKSLLEFFIYDLKPCSINIKNFNGTLKINGNQIINNVDKFLLNEIYYINYYKKIQYIPEKICDNILCGYGYNNEYISKLTKFDKQYLLFKM